jgi:hypothetical protein
MRGASRPWLHALAVAAALASATTVRALETDQYWAWGLPLPDAAAAVDAKVNSDIAEVLEEVNARGASCSCRSVQKKLRRKFSYLIFLKPELWTTNTSLVSKLPGSREDELRFRKEYVYAKHSSRLDVIRWLPPSPTIEVGGVRIGTDKLSHFFSEGAWLHTWYRGFLKKGVAPEEALRRAVLRGVLTERTILGGTSSGVLSLADLEANAQGLVFWNGLCGGADPALLRTASGWRLERRFDLRAVVSPEWDESWQPNVYTAARWKKVRPVLGSYCEALRSPWVSALREDYARRDTTTLTETIVAGLVAEGNLADPEEFTIDAVCGLPRRSLQAVAGHDDEPQ